MKTGYDLIAEATEIFKIRRSKKSFMGLLYPNNETKNEIFSYGHPALYVKGEINKENTFFASIGSVDDSGVSFHYKSAESLHEASVQMDNFIAWIEDWEFRCPSMSEIKKFAATNGCYSDKW